eukprot:GFYU01000691.1.p1 GENE.GFYU01000691.1~~GFYU01000691.1.p1  ORF type:complete len:497 (+),score=83.72 GFYU01000691.1:141-1631(+)
MCEVFTWGSGIHGQLGHGEVKDECEPRLLESLQGMQLNDIACGAEQTVIVTADGRVFAWGCGWGGWPGTLWGCGWSCLGGDQMVPRVVECCDTIKVKGIGCGMAHPAGDEHGYSHCTAISDDGLLYTWGWGGYGQLGHGETRDLPIPHLVDEMARCKVKEIACGGTHNVALSDGGDVYTWGCGWGGRLGHGDTKDHFKPRRIATVPNFHVLQVSVGYCKAVTNCEGLSHVAAVTSRGELFTWGWGVCGQLGHGDRTDQWVPKRVEELLGKFIVQVACGATHTVALTDNGAVYTWGWGKYGQLGHGNRKDYFVPTPIKALRGQDIVQVACGHYHSVAVTRNGEVYTWGWGQCGQLGHGFVLGRQQEQIAQDELYPRRVGGSLVGRRVARVVCGGAHTVAVTDAINVDSSLSTGFWKKEDTIHFYRHHRNPQNARNIDDDGFGDFKDDKRKKGLKKGDKRLSGSRSSSGALGSSTRSTSSLGGSTSSPSRRRGSVRPR